MDNGILAEKPSFFPCYLKKYCESYISNFELLICKVPIFSVCPYNTKKLFKSAYGCYTFSVNAVILCGNTTVMLSVSDYYKPKFRKVNTGKIVLVYPKSIMLDVG